MVPWLATIWSLTRPGTRHLRGSCMLGGGILGMGTESRHAEGWGVGESFQEEELGEVTSFT